MMTVASPYALFRASDQPWTPPTIARLPIPAFASAPRRVSRPGCRPRKRLAPVAVIQGELFDPPSR
jgi:hypothetical protein